jgi:short subunit dehydrogenase-like uncharacterized protein
MSRPFDLIVYGASGFTGRLVAEHFVSSYGQVRVWVPAYKECLAARR